MSDLTGMSDLTVDRFESALAFALDRVDENADAFGDAYPGPASGRDLTYDLDGDPLNGWTPAFWTGLLWLAYEREGDDRYREIAAGHLDDFERRFEEGNPLTHDLGFLYTLSAWAHHDLTGSARARQVALQAADLLADRYLATPGIVQAWGEHRPGLVDPEDDRYGMTIVDAMMNLPLLYRAAEATGYERYREIAATHARRTAEHAVRDDGTTCHGFSFDVESGEFLGQTTHQGYADDSCWARGQAWTVYGFPLSYRHTGDAAFLDVGKVVADRFLAELPADGVPAWDFRAEEDPDLRDSSAGAVAACGLFELAEHLPRADPDRRRYERAALELLDSLAAGYTTEGADSDGILRAGAYNWHEDSVEECTIWGDYFYVEGLVRAVEDWTPWW